MEDVMSDLLSTWNTITGWLAANAPASHRALRPGATAAAIRSAEDGTGASLPTGLVILLSASGGTVDTSARDRDPDEYDPGLFFAQHHLLPPEAIAEVRDSAATADFWGSWTPFAVTDFFLAPWDGLAIDAEGRLASFQLSGGEPPQRLTDRGYESLDALLRALAEALTLGTGPLTAEAVPGLHREALVWGPLPGDDAPWTPVHG
jgi:hypothetical protein